MSSGTLKQMLGQRLADVRSQRGWTQEQLADEMDSSENYISAVENGRKNVTLGQLEKFADALDVEPVTLLPVAGSAYKQGLKDARYMAETAWVEFSHQMSLAMQKVPKEGSEDVEGELSSDPARLSAGEERDRPPGGGSGSAG